MANVKFSDFDVKTSTADVAFIVGYDGSDNVRITSANFLGDYLPLAGGTMTGNTLHGDDVKSTYGDANDLQIYHDGGNSYINDVGTGDLILRSGNDLRLQSSTNEAYLTCNENGSVEVYYNNAKKLETTSTGVEVTGNGIFTGNVGIGTSSPSAPLDVRRSDSSGIVAEFNNNVGYGINFNVESDGGNNTISSGNNQSLAFVTNGGSNERMRIDITGNVGIGTASPAYKLHNTGTSRLEGRITLGGNANNFIEGVSGGINFKSASSTSFIRGSNTNLIILETGNVGIGSTNPLNKLDVVGNINVSGGDGSYLTFNNGDANIVINNNGSGKDLSFKTYNGTALDAY